MKIAEVLEVSVGYFFEDDVPLYIDRMELGNTINKLHLEQKVYFEELIIVYENIYKRNKDFVLTSMLRIYYRFFGDIKDFSQAIEYLEAETDSNSKFYKTRIISAFRERKSDNKIKKIIDEYLNYLFNKE